jgi:spore maturation protein A
MLNYIWAGLILFSLIFALSSDISDLRNHTYANGTPLLSTITYRNAADSDSREAAVDVRIEPTEYTNHFTATEPLAGTYPATLVRMDKGSLLRFAKDANLPPRFAAMRDFSDAKELTATVERTGPVNDRAVAANLLFQPVRFVKLRAITTAATDMAQTAVELSLKLIGTLALWLGLMKIAENCGLIELMVRIIQPILRPLFPSIPKGHPALGYIAVNLAGNILGLGNATTAMGLKAMEELQKLNPSDDTATDPMVMLLAIHTAAFQLVPVPILVAMLGTNSAASIFFPMLLVGLMATGVAVIAAKVLGRLPMYRRTNPQIVAARQAEALS